MALKNNGIYFAIALNMINSYVGLLIIKYLLQFNLPSITIPMIMASSSTGLLLDNLRKQKIELNREAIPFLTGIIALYVVLGLIACRSFVTVIYGFVVGTGIGLAVFPLTQPIASILYTLKNYVSRTLFSRNHHQ